MGLKDYFTFGGENCSDYGVHASGQSTFDAPVKEYESYSIPGRSGDLKIFDGRYSNIKVTYPCVYDKVGNDFSKDIAGLRNALLCKDGYQRLWDSHHPDEYRLGIYEGGLEVDPTSHGLKATFDVEFDCKPQRYLTSGEVAVPVANNGKITNPTRFPSSPLLEVEGYGNIKLNGHTVSILSGPVGKATLFGIEKNFTSADLTQVFQRHDFYAGDPATVSAAWSVTFTLDIEGATIDWSSVTFPSGAPGPSYITSPELVYTARIVSPSGYISIDIGAPNIPFSAGEAGTRSYQSCQNVQFDYSLNGTTHTCSGILYTSHSFTFGTDSVTVHHSSPSWIRISEDGETMTVNKTSKSLGGAIVTSSMSALGNPLYFDLENGEAWKYENDEYISVNSSVWLGADLPTLKPGVNRIKYDNTILSLKIKPRWWRL